MELTKNQIDELNIELTIAVKAEDYAESARKKLSEARRKAEFKGFRKGNVPVSLVEKIYGGKIVADAVNDVVSEQLNNFIKEGKLNLIGEPMSSEKQPDIEWVKGNDFTFIFDMAVAPEVKLEVDSKDTVQKYVINVTAKAVDEMKENMVKYDESKKDKPEDELKEEARKILENQYAQEAGYRLSKDIRDYFVKKADITLPEAFMRRWLIYINDGKHTVEEIDKDFASFIEGYKWQMVRDFLFTKFGHKIEEDDLTNMAKDMINYQYAMYGMTNVPEDLVNEAVTNVLKDEEQIRHIVEQIQESKVMESIKDVITVKDKKIALDAFRAL